ncbi:MAG: tRNA guanosine(15) transglycosylase TgtA [Halobacteriales archaeon]|nr:tRNA guanosine(15) transglycosylase TgtA [Halobacteriales archaeon]
MTQGLFDLRDCDANGRIGHFTVPRSNVVVETPALLPVINPKLQTISPSTLASKFGAQILITNSYIIHQDDHLHAESLEKGLHEFLDFPGAIMTDSGSFQLAEYGNVDVTASEIIHFQDAIGSDIATPLDIPTPPDAPLETAQLDLETTFERLELSKSLVDGDMLISAPIQGSTHLDLREQAAKQAYALGFEVFPIGAAVPLLTQYRFKDVVDIIMATKRGLGFDAIVHLFGAGHPMMFALAVAAGCDLFDSAAYALYARRGSYLTTQGTKQLADLDHFPCHCPVCSTYAPSELRTLSKLECESLLAEHNLYVSFGELNRIKVAIKEGNLLELVELRSASHPAMLDGCRALFRYSAQLERQDPSVKGTFFHISDLSPLRPEIVRHHNHLSRINIGTNVLLTTDTVPPPSASNYSEILHVKPPFGPFPYSLSHTYPLTAEIPFNTDLISLKQAVVGISTLVSLHPKTAFTFAHNNWPQPILETLPDDVKFINLSS